MGQCNLTGGVELCRLVHSVSPAFGIFPALTGGVLYRDGQRKDYDVILYHHRQLEQDYRQLGAALLLLGITDPDGNALWRDADPRWCTKAKWAGNSVDFLCPDVEGDNYADLATEAELESLI